MVSKSGKLYYNEDEKAKALENNNALEYALSRGYNLIRKGRYYTMKEHDSMVFDPAGKWSWNSRNIIKGSALDFIQQYEGKNEIEAILILAGSTGYVPSPKIKEQLSKMDKEKKPLDVPERSKDVEQIRRYLVQERGISPRIFEQLVRENKLYQSKKWKNVVMVGMDSTGAPKYISQRSSDSTVIPTYKLDAIGSDKSYPFVIEGIAKNGIVKNDTVIVLESPIEAMSYWSICECTNSERMHCHMISLGGTSTVSLDRYLAEHPGIKNIVVATNNDKDKLVVNPVSHKSHTVNAGKANRETILRKYGDTYKVSFHTPHLNDWNDVIKNIRQKSFDKQLQQMGDKQPAVKPKAKGMER